MFDEKYKSLFQKIQVREEHKEITKVNMQRELNKMNSKQDSHRLPFYRYAIVAVMLFIATTIILNWWGNNREKELADGGLTPSKVDTPTQGETTIRYSQLNFEESIPLDVPVVLNDLTGKIAGFTENLLSESNSVIKGTVTNISFKEYKDELDIQSIRQSVIYEVKVDKIYYSTLSFNVEETMIIENDLYTYTSLANSVEKLNSNRQYLLLIKESDGELSIIYPFAPQIEITVDGEYIFPEHWTSLIDENTKTVTMDVEGELTYYGGMKLREDPEFEEDFEKIVDIYCE